MSTSTGVTLGVVGFFLLLAAVVLLRVLSWKHEPRWRRFRAGFFFERDPNGGKGGDDK